MNRFNCSILTIFALIALVGCGAIDNQISTNAVNSSYETGSSVSGSIVSGGSVSCDDSKKVLVDRNVPRSAIKFAKSIYKKLVTDYHEDEKKDFPDFQKNKSLAKNFPRSAIKFAKKMGNSYGNTPEAGSLSLSGKSTKKVILTK